MKSTSMRSTNLNLLRRRAIVWAAFAVAMLVAAPTVRAGDECLSSKLTNELMDCAHCTAFKKLLSHRAIGKVTMEIHELDRGAIVEIEATHESAVELVHDLVSEIWNTEAHCETTMSAVCSARVHELRELDIDRALTSHGALVVLRATDTDKADWAVEDARDARSYVLAAASR